MSLELTDLLPRERARAFRKDYFLRLATVAVIALCALVVIHGILLLPSYVYVLGRVSSYESRIAALDATLAASEEQEVNARLSALRADTEYLSRLKDSVAGSDAIRGILGISRPGITLTGFSFTPPVSGKEGKMTVSGTASTREALRSYNLALASASFISRADLPISAYAAERDIRFVITLSGSLSP